jgi:hypothetical protein
MAICGIVLNSAPYHRDRASNAEVSMQRMGQPRHPIFPSTPFIIPNRIHPPSPVEVTRHRFLSPWKEERNNMIVRTVFAVILAFYVGVYLKVSLCPALFTHKHTHTHTHMKSTTSESHMKRGFGKG